MLLKRFLRAFDVSLKKRTTHAYNHEFVARVIRGEKDSTVGKGVKVDPENLN
jgi:hypothetical protein